MTIWVILLFIGVAWWWFSVTPVPVAPSIMEFERIIVDGPTALCPGDILDYIVVLHVKEPGIYSVDVSVWRITPPSTVIFSVERRFVASQPAHYELRRQWRIPTNHVDPTTGELVEWLPGSYERRLAISTASRATEPSIVTAPFSIRADCAP